MYYARWKTQLGSLQTTKKLGAVRPGAFLTFRWPVVVMRPVCLGTPFHFYPAEPLVPGVFDPRSPQAVLPRRQAGTNEELKGQVIRMRPTERADAMETERLYRPGDKDTPEELEELLRRVLSKHPENSTNSSGVSL